MRLYVCAVYDKAVGAYMAPMFFRTKGEGMRSFMDAVANEQAPFAKHAADYHFSHLGWYDDGTGSLSSLEAGPVPLITALECLKLGEEERRGALS